jgi:dTMP kinase
LNKGFFITLEGGEGVGKSTQTRFIAEFLKDRGHKVLTTREPGGTIDAEKIRHLIVDRDGGNWSPLEETLLLFTARMNHIEHKIKPALDRGEIVICDRFTDSTIAYQGYGRGVDLDLIKLLQEKFLNNFKPDLTFLFDLDPQIGLARSSKRQIETNSTEDKFENLDIQFHETLRNAFLTLARSEPSRFAILEASQSIETIQSQISKTLIDKGF